MKKGNNNPTDVFKAFINAQLNNDVETMKSILSKDTLQITEKVCVNHKKSFNEAVIPYGHLILGHLIPGVTPKTGKEIFGGNVACLEVKNTRTNEFDTFIFQKEGDAWKLALELEFVDTVRSSIFDDLMGYLKAFFRNLFAGKES